MCFIYLIKYNIPFPGGQTYFGSPYWFPRWFSLRRPLPLPRWGRRLFPQYPHLFAPGWGIFCISFFDKKFGLFGRVGLPSPCPHITRSPYVCHIPPLYILIFGYVSHTCFSVCHTCLFPLSFTLLVFPYSFSLHYHDLFTLPLYPVLECIIWACFPWLNFPT